MTPSTSGMSMPKSLGSFLLNKRLCQTSHCIFKFQLVLLILLDVMSICFNLWSQVLFWGLDLFTPGPKSDPHCAFKLRTTRSWFQVFIYLLYFLIIVLTFAFVLFFKVTPFFSSPGSTSPHTWESPVYYFATPQTRLRTGPFLKIT